MVISNWSRRPSRELSFSFPVAALQSGGAKSTVMLCRFIRKWMDTHPMIDDGYKKCYCKIGKDGNPKVSVIFYSKPGIGRIHRVLKTEFVFMVTEAARRLKMILSSTEFWTRPDNFWNETNDNLDIMEHSNQDDVMMEENENLSNTVSLDDLLPSDDLSNLSGYDYDWVVKKRKKCM